MILSDIFDYSTNDVMEWLKCLGGEFTRVNGRNTIESKEFYVTPNNIFVNNQDVKFNKINIIWFRRWVPNYIDEIFEIKEDIKFQNQVNRYMSKEFIC